MLADHMLHTQASIKTFDMIAVVKAPRTMHQDSGTGDGACSILKVPQKVYIDMVTNTECVW